MLINATLDAQCDRNPADVQEQCCECEGQRDLYAMLRLRSVEKKCRVKQTALNSVALSGDIDTDSGVVC